MGANFELLPIGLIIIKRAEIHGHSYIRVSVCFQLFSSDWPTAGEPCILMNGNSNTRIDMNSQLPESSLLTRVYIEGIADDKIIAMLKFSSMNVG